MRYWVLILLMCFGACTSLERKEIPLACSVQAEGDMSMQQFSRDLYMLKSQGFDYFQLDIPLIRGEAGMPAVDTTIVKILPLLSRMSAAYFPDWTLAIVRLHPDSIIDSISFRKQGSRLWCEKYIQASETYLERLSVHPTRLVAGSNLPGADSILCLNTWLQNLSLKYKNLTWLIPEEELPHPLHTHCTETGIIRSLTSDEASKPLARKMNQYIAEICGDKPVFIGAFYPRSAYAETDFINLLRFWPDQTELSGITFASLFPRPVILDTLSPGSAGYQTELIQEIEKYLSIP